MGRLTLSCSGIDLQLVWIAALPGSAVLAKKVEDPVGARLIWALLPEACQPTISGMRQIRHCKVACCADNNDQRKALSISHRLRGASTHQACRRRMHYVREPPQRRVRR
ncbi:hypothetical protein XAP412_800003 [Xanthomonas phaseoli pv. phaseoli]|uniref:Transposase n=1 Tax=Xanthomonas campestris pv. phaseoli TaxID=317013 RepID=A0AB38E6C0_XANCH|nr:hypothetical protein XAP6984_840003 [Xanthomonas phaseoli pv. phaseoli]SON90806.1 hypothetical protein XAP412_800003 [Xanthomonas phaseoli pv. phaseoli]SON92665.1 hypothetical protein XAP7430_800003 [Xanthomonas phaseoli pv. phaseoli]SOO29585.1 hypothetical protein XAP6164_3430014 [Xanthomonas phaseoli pv. phaseoli]